MSSSGPLIVERMDVSPIKNKRKREEERYAVDLGARPLHPTSNTTRTDNTNHDIFEQAFAGTDTTATDNSVYSSWLTTSHVWTHHSVKRATPRHYGVVSLKEQIHATQEQLLQLKRRFGLVADECALVCSSTPSQEFNQARSMCNPFEGVCQGMLLNRAGIKLANIDALLEFCLVRTHDTDFTFVDLCGAPGGFSEYVMKRCESLANIQNCRGWGMSLCGINEHGHGAPWKLHNVVNNNNTPSTNGTSTFYKICQGSDGTGDVYQWSNVESLQQQVIGARTAGNGVHLVVADGGFDAQRNAECQEQVACKLVVCQASAALLLLRKGGTLVMKMFGFQTRTTRTLIKFMLTVFEKITVVKPISSRPASAERYVIFEGYKGTPHDFDGRKWQSSILLGETNGIDPQHNDDEFDANLQDCLDECDGDILQLNQKACFEILSYMERKTLGAWQQQMMEKPPINMLAYKHEWRL